MFDFRCRPTLVRLRRFPLLAGMLLPALLAGCWGGDDSPAPASGFMVGGSITGLGADGLRLANGSDTVALVAGATAFTFATPLATGATFAVAVAAQPAGETCSVAGGSGTVGTASVTAVQVTCAPARFSVGGSISGLTGTGLVLANGTDTRTVAVGATGFAMPTLVATGGAYAITVQAQPTGAHCSIANAIGTVAGGNVSNVAVTCAANAHTLGGTIAGLPSAGLVLSNGTDTVSPAAGALSFTFPVPVAEGGTYAVAVRTQPSGATCSIGSGSGTVGTSDIATVQVTCAANAYRVGGTISGLASTGLVLANGSDTVTPAANATAFTFAHPVAFGGTYSVTVQQQPVAQTCAVAGTFPATIGAGDVTNVAVTCITTTQFPLVAGRETCPASGPQEIDGTGSGASMASVYKVGAFDSAGNLYVISTHLTLRKVTPAGVVTTIAGQYFTGGSPAQTDGTGAAATFGSPQGMTVDSSGNVYVTDQFAIRKVTPAGVVTTLAGNATVSGFTDATGSNARFSNPLGIAVDSAGNLFVSDFNAVRKITPAGVVTTYAGFVNLAGYTDGPLSGALFNSPQDQAFDAAGNLFVLDSGNSVVRKITPGGVVSTFAGTPPAGFADGTGPAARFGQPSHVSIDGAGNLFVEDDVGSAVRLITPGAVVTTLATTQLFTTNTGQPPPSGSITLPINTSNPLLVVNGTGKLYLPVGCAIEKAGP
jgi:hypothetical protein